MKHAYAYEPVPGTIPHRAIERLKELNARAKLDNPDAKPVGVPAAELAEFLGIETVLLTNYLGTARKHGALRTERNLVTHGRPLVWFLGDGVSQLQPADFDPDQPFTEQDRPPRERPRVASVWGLAEVATAKAAQAPRAVIDPAGLLVLESHGEVTLFDTAETAAIRQALTWARAA